MKRVIKPLITILVLGLGAGIMWHLISSRPRPRRMPLPPMSVNASVINPEVISAGVEVQAMGEVIAAREVVITPEVSGRITYVNPKLYLGSHFAAGELLATIESTDYKMAVEQAEAAVAQAKVTLEEQEALSAAAQEELKLLDKRGVGINEQGKRLASRKAYVESAKAQLDSARSKLEQARLKLARCQIKAPFSSAVKSKNVALGQVVSTGSTLATMVADDEVHVVVSVMLDQLRWLSFPNKDQPGSLVELIAATTGINTVIKGHVLTRLPQLKEKSQLAQLLVRVPQGDAESRLLIGSVVNVTIFGRQVDNVVRLPRQAMRDNSTIYVVDKEKRLQQRTVNVVFSDRQNYYLENNLDLQERIVTSRLSLSVPGLPVKIDGEESDDVAASFVPPDGSGGLGQPGSKGGVSGRGRGI